MKYRQRGFVALMTAVIVSAILIALMASVSFASFYARFDGLGDMERQQALALARSCMYVALDTLAASSSLGAYHPSDQVVAIDATHQCVIESVTYALPDATIVASASSQDSFASISTTVALSQEIKIISWTESP